MKKLLLILLCFLTVTSYSQKKNKYAKDIEVSLDKFDGEQFKKWNSPYFGKGIASSLIQPVTFTKIKKDGDIVRFLTLRAYGSTLNIGEKGVVILFTDGVKIEFPNAEIDVESGVGSYWEYRAFIKISAEELDKFIRKDLDEFRLYIYDSGVMSKRQIKRIKGWAQAIKEAI